MHSVCMRLMIKQSSALRAAAKLSSSVLMGAQPKSWQLCHKSKSNVFSFTQRMCSSSSATQPQIEESEDEDPAAAAAENENVGTSKVIYYTPAEIYENPSLLTLITNGDPEAEKTLRILCLELDVFRQSGRDVPDSLSVESWKDLLQMSSVHKRTKFYRFLFIKSCIKAKEKEKRKRKSEEYLAYLEQKKENADADSGHLKYGLMNNGILLRIYESTITEYNNYRLIRCMEMQEQKLFIDCGFEQNMSQLEISSFSKQLMIAFRDNRAHDQPFDLHLCNARPEDRTLQDMQKSMPTLFNKTFPLNITEKNYTDVVPKKNIVYLTPHCREVMDEFDHDANYIIGGIVDRSNQEPLSLAKAKKEGLRMAKLPLDQYLNWGQSGSKSLTINQVVCILLDLRMTGDWEYALRHVPRRKLRTDEEFLRSTSKFSKHRNPFASWDERGGNRFKR
ncbi:mitochondrial ribonuclease P protein 1 homolog [Cloeon dipterum]|uniref:mitochondrial ribonuclease P protein 1 homolog n=1 Tax=Cloeon dipterum TaxID=197152 RepID=UPI00321F6F37